MKIVPISCDICPAMSLVRYETAQANMTSKRKMQLYMKFNYNASLGHDHQGRVDRIVFKDDKLYEFFMLKVPAK